MRIAFNEKDFLPGDRKDIYSYDCFLNGKLFEKPWCLADEERGIVKHFARDENGKILISYNGKPIIEMTPGTIELKLKQTRETR